MRRPRPSRQPEPARGQCRIDALELPELNKEPLVALHRLRIEDRVDRRVDLVIEHERVPPNFAVRVGQHACVKPAADVRWVELGVGAADSGFKLSR